MTGNFDTEKTAASTAGPQVPLHRRIAENLHLQVKSGTIKPGDKLPSERKIAQKFQASRATVRTALQHLEQEGIITRRDRRSAVVAIRRDITPSLRIACSQPRLVNLMRRLADLQVLPPRCQLHLQDIQQPNSIRELLTQPISGADLLICELEYVRCLMEQKDILLSPPTSLFANIHLPPSLQAVFIEGDKYLAVPLAISPMVMYYNRETFQHYQQPEPAGNGIWENLLTPAQIFRKEKIYGLQFRPTFSHLSAMMVSLGSQIYQKDGIVTAGSRMATHEEVGRFEYALRFIYDLLHVNKFSPILAKVDQINLFAQKRSAMSVDGFDMFNHYREKLGHNLAVATLPEGIKNTTVFGGFAAVILGEHKNPQPIEDLLRTLLNVNTQRLLIQMSAYLPVNSSLLNQESFQANGVSLEIAQCFLQEIQNHKNMVNLAISLEHKYNVENLLLELWLGLDNIDNICRRFKELTGP